ncbi:nucleoside diphosphate kinase, partial [Rhizophagus irregularis]
LARIMMGATKPEESSPGTIRGDYAVTISENVIHGSDSPASAEREIQLWFASELV